MIRLGCIPGAAFRNQDFVEKQTRFAAGLDYNLKMLLLDPQTSGGLLMIVPPDDADAVVQACRSKGYPETRVIGKVLAAAGPALAVQ